MQFQRLLKCVRLVPACLRVCPCWSRFAPALPLAAVRLKVCLRSCLPSCLLSCYPFGFTWCLRRPSTCLPRDAASAFSQVCFGASPLLSHSASPFLLMVYLPLSSVVSSFLFFFERGLAFLYQFPLGCGAVINFECFVTIVLTLSRNQGIRFEFALLWVYTISRIRLRFSWISENL